MRTLILTVGILTGALLLACAAAPEIPAGMAGATFAVHCYDVGASALDGKPGVIAVQRGWSGGNEVDRVVYDPEAVSLLQLENWLKDADTYVGTLEQTMEAGTGKETTP